MNSQVEKFLNRYRDSPSTKSTWESALKKYQEFCDERGIDIINADPPEVEQYLLWMSEEGYLPNTIASHYEALRQFYASLEGFFDEIEESPFEHLTRKRYVKKSTAKHNSNTISYLPKNEIDLLCQNVPSPTLRNRLMIQMMFHTALRESEVVEVKIENIDREERRIELFRTKTDEWGEVYYQPSLDILLNQWLEGGYRDKYVTAENSPYCFVSRKKEKMRDERPNKIIKKAAENAGIQEVMYEDKAGKKRHKVTSHCIRHSHAVHALKSGVNLRALQKQMNHSDIKQTQVYLQLVGSDVREEYKKFKA